LGDFLGIVGLSIGVSLAATAIEAAIGLPLGALSRSGPLGFLQLLYTPAAMVIAQAILAAPIITALVYRASERAWARYGDELISDGATRLQAIPQILLIIRARVFANWLASREGQEAISAYRVNGERLFNPSADAPK
jgi:tungstate transport system permease protein